MVYNGFTYLSLKKMLIAYCLCRTINKWFFRHQHNDCYWRTCLQVFQRRRDGTVDFYRTWDEYSAGFGQPDGEFWIG